MFMSLFDDDYILEAYVKDRVKDYAKDEAKKTAISMIKDGDMSLEKIAKYIPLLSLDELRELEAEVIKSA
ncbi:MAG: hypothetical protein HFE90_07880 [Firmicutes bacterium]|nr:hypothetical protein [Bacillota bacterium]